MRNARADAEAMGTALQKAGYAVTVMKDRNLKQMKDDVREFKSLIKGGDEVFFFYSGHGVQIEAMNYLLPVDVRAESEDQVRDDALALSNVLSDLRAQKPCSHPGRRRCLQGQPLQRHRAGNRRQGLNRRGRRQRPDGDLLGGRRATGPGSPE